MTSKNRNLLKIQKSQISPNTQYFAQNIQIFFPTLSAEDINLLSQIGNIPKFFTDEIESVVNFVDLMKMRMEKCQKYESEYFAYLSWITELDLELTNICHLSQNISVGEKSFRLAEIKINAEERGRVKKICGISIFNKKLDYCAKIYLG